MPFQMLLCDWLIITEHNAIQSDVCRCEREGGTINVFMYVLQGVWVMCIAVLDISGYATVLLQIVNMHLWIMKCSVRTLQC